MHLDDNTRSGLHYLSLGGVVLFALMLVDRWLDGFLRPVDPALAVLTPFQHGYLLGAGIRIVDAGSTRGERIAWAIVASVAAGIVLGLVVHGLSRNRGLSLATARLGMVLLLGWGCYAALFVPVRSFFVGRDGVLVERRYARFLPDVPVPFTGTTSLHAGTVHPNAVHYADRPPCGRLELILRNEHDLLLSQVDVRSDDCDHAIADFEGVHASAAGLINAHLHRR